jgi:hypothetical protein
MSQAVGIEDLRDINVSERDIKGYRFEVLVSKLLDKSGIDYSANPLNSIKVWKQYQGRGSDFKILSLNIELEAKSGYARIFKSWIMRDWIPRFSYHNEIRVIILKPTLKLSSKVFDLLFSYNINLIYPDSISYLIGKGNKVLEPNSSKSIEANKLLEAENIKNQSTEKQNTEKQKQKSEIEGLELISSKSSSTFKDKFRTKLRLAFLNLLSKTKMLVLNLFHDTSGRLPRTTKYKTRKWILSGYRNRSILEYCSDKVKRSRLHPVIKTCPYKTTLICLMGYFKPKYICGFPFGDKIQYCDDCKDIQGDENVNFYDGRPLCEHYKQRCYKILQSYESINLENSPICYWISTSERTKLLKEITRWEKLKFGDTHGEAQRNGT